MGGTKALKAAVQVLLIASIVALAVSVGDSFGRNTRGIPVAANGAAPVVAANVAAATVTSRAAEGQQQLTSFSDAARLLVTDNSVVTQKKRRRSLAQVGPTNRRRMLKERSTDRSRGGEGDTVREVRRAVGQKRRGHSVLERSTLGVPVVHGRGIANPDSFGTRKGPRARRRKLKGGKAQTSEQGLLEYKRKGRAKSRRLKSRQQEQGKAKAKWWREQGGDSSGGRAGIGFVLRGDGDEYQE